MSSTTVPFLTIAQAVQWTGKSDKTIRRLIRRYTDDNPELAKRYLEVRNRGQRKFWKLSSELLKQEFDLPDSYLSTMPEGSASEPKLFATEDVQDDLSRTIDDWADIDRQIKQTAQTNDQTVSNTSDQDNSATVSGELALLKHTVEELSRQLKVKDEQILANTKLLDRLTSAIEQGNFLVASAQQRIPLPESDTSGSSSSTPGTDSNSQGITLEPLHIPMSQPVTQTVPFANKPAERRSWLRWLYGWMEE